MFLHSELLPVIGTWFVGPVTIMISIQQSHDSGRGGKDGVYRSLKTHHCLSHRHKRLCNISHSKKFLYHQPSSLLSNKTNNHEASFHVRYHLRSGFAYQLRKVMSQWLCCSCRNRNWYADIYCVCCGHESCRHCNFACRWRYSRLSTQETAHSDLELNCQMMLSEGIHAEKINTQGRIGRSIDEPGTGQE